MPFTKHTNSSERSFVVMLLEPLMMGRLLDALPFPNAPDYGVVPLHYHSEEIYGERATVY